MATRGRPPGQGKVPGSGRKKGSLDRSARLLISEQVAFDILKTYKRLGPDWLFKIAQERPDLFINQCLSKILPPAFKEGDDLVLNQQINIGHVPDREAAMRVAFLLNSAMQENPTLAPLAERVSEPDISPQEALNKWHPETVAEPLLRPEPVDDPARDEWAASLPLTPEERADQKLIKQTRTATIENYSGSSTEQGLGPAQHQTSGRKPTVSEIRRKQLL